MRGHPQIISDKELLEIIRKGRRRVVIGPTQPEIAKAVNMSHPGISLRISRLEKKGIIEHSPVRGYLIVKKSMELE
jgi:DNA-binding Lrp family transcriptional regulator